MELPPYIYWKSANSCDGNVQGLQNFSPTIIADLFDIRQNNCFAIPNVKSVYHGTGSLSNLGPRIYGV